MNDSRICAALLRKSFDIRDSRPKADGGDIDAALEVTVSPLGKHEIDSLVFGKTVASRALFLPSVPAGRKALAMRPLLTWKAAHDREPLRLYLYCVYQTNGQLVAWCNRFEGPEAQGDAHADSIHAYWHAQWCGRGDLSTTIAPLVQPPEQTRADSIPAVPVAAAGTAELLVALLLSLYGPRKLLDEWITTVPERDAVGEVAQKVLKACGFPRQDEVRGLRSGTGRTGRKR